MMKPLNPHAAEKARIRRSVGSSWASFATLGLRPIQVHSLEATSGSQVCTSRYRYRRSKLKTQSFCTVHLPAFKVEPLAHKQAERFVKRVLLISTDARLTLSFGCRIMFDRFPGIAREDMFQKRPFVILEHGANNCGIIGKTHPRDQVRNDVGCFSQAEQCKSGLCDCHKRNRPIQAGMKIFDYL